MKKSSNICLGCFVLGKSYKAYYGFGKGTTISCLKNQRLHKLHSSKRVTGKVTAFLGLHL